MIRKETLIELIVLIVLLIPTVGIAEEKKAPIAPPAPQVVPAPPAAAGAPAPAQAPAPQLCQGMAHRHQVWSFQKPPTAEQIDQIGVSMGWPYLNLVGIIQSQEDHLYYAYFERDGVVTEICAPPPAK